MNLCAEGTIRRTSPSHSMPHAVFSLKKAQWFALKNYYAPAHGSHFPPQLAKLLVAAIDLNFKKILCVDRTISVNNISLRKCWIWRSQFMFVLIGHDYVSVQHKAIDVARSSPRVAQSNSTPQRKLNFQSKVLPDSSASPMSRFFHNTPWFGAEKGATSG